MHYTNFARIGNANLLKALGLKTNYKQDLVKVDNSIDKTCCTKCSQAGSASFDVCKDCPRAIPKVDFGLSGCYDCSNFVNRQHLDMLDPATAAMTIATCKNCSTAVQQIEYKTVYVNERNKYLTPKDRQQEVTLGKPLVLGKNALKLYLHIHFLNADKSGIVRNISFSKLSKILNCDIRTIKTNMQLLMDYGYILYTKSSSYRGRYTIVILGYKDYYLTASQGGRGYFSMSKDILDAITNITDTTELRITLRTIVETNIHASNSKEISMTTTYSDIRRALPTYCKPNIIRKALANSFISLQTYEEDNEELILTIPAEYNSNLLKHTAFDNDLQRLGKHIDDLNTNIDTLKSSKASISEKQKIESDLINNNIAVPLFSAELKHFIVKTQDLNDLAAISIKFGFDITWHCLANIYNDYILKNVPIENLPALTRTYIQNILFTKIYSIA